MKYKYTKVKGNRQICVAKEFLRLRKVSLNNIISPEGVILRINRLIQFECALGCIK